MKSKINFAALLMATMLLSFIVKAQDNQKPNVVIMMVDNLGWGEIGAYGGGILRGPSTPNLDKMADEGIKLLNFNVETFTKNFEFTL